MKSPSLLSAALLAFGVAIGVSGCAGTPFARKAPAHVPTFALAVSVAGGSQLTPEQWKTIHTAFARQLADYGLTLVDDISLAERIIRVNFTPDPADPTTGQAVVLNVRVNPAYGYVSPSGSSSASMASYTLSNPWDYSSYNNWSYGYIDPLYLYGSPSGVVTIAPPRHRPNDPDHPPGKDNPPGHDQPGQDHPGHDHPPIAGNDGDHDHRPRPDPDGTQHHPWIPGPTRSPDSSRPQPTYARPEPGYSRPEPNYSRPEPSYSRPEPSYSSVSSSSSSSNSSSSYSPPASSSSSSSSSDSFSPGSSSSSSSSSSPEPSTSTYTPPENPGAGSGRTILQN